MCEHHLDGLILYFTTSGHLEACDQKGDNAKDNLLLANEVSPLRKSDTKAYGEYIGGIGGW